MSTILNILGPFLQERSYKKLGAEPFARAAVADWDEFVSTKFSDMVISMTQHELRRYQYVATKATAWQIFNEFIFFFGTSYILLMFNFFVVEEMQRLEPGLDLSLLLFESDSKNQLSKFSISNKLIHSIYINIIQLRDLKKIYSEYIGYIFFLNNI